MSNSLTLDESTPHQDAIRGGQRGQGSLPSQPYYSIETGMARKLKELQSAYQDRMNLSLKHNRTIGGLSDQIQGVSENHVVVVGGGGGGGVREMPCSFSPLGDLISLDILYSNLSLNKNIGSSNSNSNRYSVRDGSNGQQALNRLHSDRNWNNPKALSLMMMSYDVPLNCSYSLASAACNGDNTSYVDIQRRQNKYWSRQVVDDVKFLFDTKLRQHPKHEDYVAAMGKLADAIDLDGDNLEALVYRAECNFIFENMSSVEKDILVLEHRRRSNAKALSSDLVARLNKLKELSGISDSYSDVNRTSSSDVSHHGGVKTASSGGGGGGGKVTGALTSTASTFSASISGTSSSSSSSSAAAADNIPSLLALVSSSIEVGRKRHNSSDNESDDLTDKHRKIKKEKKRYKKDKREKKDRKKKSKKAKKSKKEKKHRKKGSKKKDYSESDSSSSCSSSSSSSSSDESDDEINDERGHSRIVANSSKMPLVQNISTFAAVNASEIEEEEELHPILSRPKHKLWG